MPNNGMNDEDNEPDKRGGVYPTRQAQKERVLIQSTRNFRDNHQGVMSIHNITQGTTAEIRQATDSRDRQRCGSSGSHINKFKTSTALVKLSVPDGHQKVLGAVERGNYKSNVANLARSDNGDDYRPESCPCTAYRSP
jgi:hypothetical protein